MKILFIHNKYQQAGGEDVAVDLEVRLFRQHGHEVSELLFDNKALQGLATKVKNGVGAVYNRQSARQLEEALGKSCPDIIHIHNIFFAASPSVLWMAAKHRIPVVFSLHNYRLICANAQLLRDNQVCHLCVQKIFPLQGIWHKCYRGSAIETGLVTLVTGLHKILHTWEKKVSAYTVNTEFARSHFQSSSFLGSKGKTHLLMNSIIDPGFPAPAAGRKDHFLFVGRISREKGLHVLLEAFAELPESKVVIIGDGPDKNMLETGYRTCKNITFAGKKDKAGVVQAMKECKALIFPSIWYEGQPFTIIEAFATGTPVLASAIGAMLEMIRDGYNGYHFPAGDAEALRKTIVRFEKHPEEQICLYENARETYMTKFHPDIHYNSLLSIYENVLNQNSL